MGGEKPCKHLKASAPGVEPRNLLWRDGADHRSAVFFCVKDEDSSRLLRVCSGWSFRDISKRWNKLIIDGFKVVALFYSDTVNHLVTPHIYLMIFLSGTKWGPSIQNTILISAWQFLSVVGGPPQDWTVSNFSPLLAHSSISKFHLGHDKLFKLYYFLAPLCHFFPSHKTSFSSKEEDYFVVTNCAGHGNPFPCLLFYYTVKSLPFFDAFAFGWECRVNFGRG